MRFRPTPLPARLALLGLAALPACNGRASTKLVTLEDAGTEMETQTERGADAGTDSSVPPAPAPSSFDTLFQTLLADLQAQPADRQPFVRYVSLTHRQLAGASEAELTAERAALSLALNSTSTRAELAPAVPVDAEALLYRIDLRDYGWERELEVVGTTFRDGWEAIIAGDPYAVVFSGTEADELARVANTVVPVVSAESVVRGATGSDVYHALAGVPAELDLGLLTRWGIERVEMTYDGEVVRVGNVDAAHIASNESVLVERYLIPETRAPIWTFTGEYTGAGDSILGNPLQFADGEAFAAFSLPNGLFCYGTYGQGGERMAGSEALPEITNPVSCFGCHVEGPVPMVDMVRGYVETNSRAFDSATVTEILAVYPPQEELDALFASDQAAYRAQLTLLGIPSDLGADVINATLARFDAPLSLTRAAAELGVEPERLSSSLTTLSPELAGLADGLEISRSDFSRLFAASLCSLHSGETGHRPVTTDCPRR